MAALAFFALAGCGGHQPRTGEVAEVPREYLGIETRMMDDELVNIRIAMKGARGPEDIDTYTGCAVAQYAQVKGMGFARPLRTTLSRTDGVFHADAIYVLSAEKPRGSKIIEAEKAIVECKAQSIPTV